jgi:subtilisin family serine protease
VRTGPLLPRVPISAGDAAPSGLQRIESVTADGVVNTEGLPAGQQVLVGVIDSGVDATHPDINYVGGQSWAASDANADRDGFGGYHAFLSHPLCLLAEAIRKVTATQSTRQSLRLPLAQQCLEHAGPAAA